MTDLLRDPVVPFLAAFMSIVAVALAWDLRSRLRSARERAEAQSRLVRSLEASKPKPIPIPTPIAEGESEPTARMPMLATLSADPTHQDEPTARTVPSASTSPILPSAGLEGERETTARMLPGASPGGAPRFRTETETPATSGANGPPPPAGATRSKER